MKNADVFTPKEEKTQAKILRKTVRFSAEEFALIMLEIEKVSSPKKRVSFSDFVRAAALKRKIKPTISKDFLAELSRQGNNLNQVAYRFNISDDEELKNLAPHLDKLTKAYQELKELLLKELA